MAILGYDTNDSADTSSLTVGRMYVSKYTLGTAQTMTELHGWFSGTANTVRIVIYADSAGSPGTRIAYTGSLSVNASPVHVQETGFSVSLAAGDYWIGFYCITSGGGAVAQAGTGGTHKGIISGASDPPPNPFGTVGTSGTRKHSCWAVVATAGAALTQSVNDTLTVADSVTPVLTTPIVYATGGGITIA